MLTMDLKGFPERFVSNAKSTKEFCCSFCEDIFRDPIFLPCKHNFCRECLRYFVDLSESSEDKGVTKSFISAPHRKKIFCPMCRSLAVVTFEDVGMLSANAEMADAKAKSWSHDHSKTDKPMCSMCDDKAAATKLCSTCDVFFCQACLILHPRRGPYKHHIMMSVSQLSAHREGESAQMPVPAFRSEPKRECDKHCQPLCTYCVTCKAVVCRDCLEEHLEHRILSVKTAVEKTKAPFVEKTENLKVLITEMKEAVTAYEELQNHVQLNQDLHTREIETAYTSALRMLDRWKKDSLHVVRKRHANWRQKCAGNVKDLDARLGEAEENVTYYENVLSSGRLEILQCPRELTKRIDEQLAQSRSGLKQHGEIKQKLERSIKGSHVAPRLLTVKENLTCAKPKLRFTTTDNDTLKITGGSTLTAYGDLPADGWCTGLTDGRFQTGRHYWELEICLQMPSPDTYCYCIVGVVQEKQEARKSRQGWKKNRGKDAWYITMQFCDDKVRYDSYCGGGVKPVYQRWKPHVGPHHLGLYLNCEDQSLTVLDPGNNQLIFIVSGVNVDEPLVPYFRCGLVKSASVRLVTGITLNLPPVLRDMLNTTES